MTKKQVRINLTEAAVPSVEDVPEQADAEMAERIVQKTREQESEDALYNTASEITDQAAPDAVIDQVTSTIQAASTTDSAKDWNRVADMLYELERNKHKLPGLMQSRLGRLLERLP